MAHEDEVNTPMVAVVGVFAAVLVFVIIVGLQVLYHSMTQAELARKDSPVASPALVDYVAQQRERLDGYRWVDPTKGVVAIPIDRAMDLVVREGRPAAEAK